MLCIETNILSVLLKNVFHQGLISEMTYRNSLSRIRTFDDSVLVRYSDMEQTEANEVLE